MFTKMIIINIITYSMIKTKLITSHIKLLKLVIGLREVKKLYSWWYAYSYALQWDKITQNKLENHKSNLFITFL